MTHILTISGAALAVVYMGIFPGAPGYASWSFALSRMPASAVGSFLYFVPARAVLIAWGWLGETPGINALISGVILVNKRGR